MSSENKDLIRPSGTFSCGRRHHRPQRNFLREPEGCDAKPRASPWARTVANLPQHHKPRAAMPISWPFSQSQRKIGSAREHKFALFERSEFSKFMRSDSFPSPDFDDFPRRRVGQRWASLPARILAQQRSTPSTRLRPSGSPCGAFSHASCCPIVFALWARLLDSSAKKAASPISRCGRGHPSFSINPAS